VVKLKLNMIVKIDSSIPNTSTAKTQQSRQSVKTPASVTQANIPRVLAATGLPSDKLSASIVSFARFFSLPLKPQLLADIRRQAMMQPPAPHAAQLSAASGDSVLASKSFTEAKTLADVKAREASQSIRLAVSLAAAAAESKGIELQQKGLEAYAEAIDPDLQRRRQDSEQQRRRRNKDRNEQTNAVTADSIKKTALEYMEKNPLTDILNKLPGKNGRRWIVLPFDFCEGDKEYFVSIRILTEDIRTEAQAAITVNIKNGEFYSNHIVFMALDVTSRDNSGKSGVRDEERRLFVFESANEKAAGLSVYFQPDPPLKAQSKIKNELSRLLEIPPERVFLKTSERTFPFEEEFAEPLASVDKAV
jgi:hypothetical protein